MVASCSSTECPNLGRAANRHTGNHVMAGSGVWRCGVKVGIVPNASWDHHRFQIHPRPRSLIPQ